MNSASNESANRGDSMRERRRRIMHQLHSNGRVEVSALASRLGVTEETIRRDLQALEKHGELVRAHGGAVQTSHGTTPWLEHPTAVGVLDAVSLSRVLSLIPRHGAVFLDGGTVAERIAASLPTDARIDLVTPNIDIAMVASENPSIQVFFTGGYVNPGTAAEEGEWARQTLMRVRLDLAVIVVEDVPRSGELLAQPGAAAVREMALQRAKRSLLVVCPGEPPEGFAIYGNAAQFDDVVSGSSHTAELPLPGEPVAATTPEVSIT